MSVSSDDEVKQLLRQMQKQNDAVQKQMQKPEHQNAEMQSQNETKLTIYPAKGRTEQTGSPRCG